jgi:hypothetical protein
MNQEYALLHEALRLCDWSQRRELAEALNCPGIRKSRFDDSEEWEAAVGGVTFRLYASGSGPHARHFHRLYVRCPVCGKEIPYGRLHQHAGQHVRKFGLDIRPNRSVWHRHYYVEKDTNVWRKMPREFQRAFPQQPGNF